MGVLKNKHDANNRKRVNQDMTWKNVQRRSLLLGRSVLLFLELPNKATSQVKNKQTNQLVTKLTVVSTHAGRLILISWIRFLFWKNTTIFPHQFCR